MRLNTKTLKLASIAAHIGLLTLSLMAPAFALVLSLSLQINSWAIALSHGYKYLTNAMKHSHRPENKNIQSVIKKPEVYTPLLNALIFAFMAILPAAILGAVSSTPVLNVVMLIALTLVSLKVSAAVIDSLTRPSLSLGNLMQSPRPNTPSESAENIAAKLGNIDLNRVNKTNILPESTVLGRIFGS